MATIRLGFFARVFLGHFVNPETGRIARVKKHATDDWGNTAQHIEEKSEHSGEWIRGKTLPGTGTGGHYS